MLGRKACTHKRGVGRADALGADPAGMTGKPEITLTSRQRSSPRVTLTTGPRVYLVFEEAPRAPLASASNSRSLATSRRYGLILSLRALLLESNADQRRAGAGSTIVFEDPSGAACCPAVIALAGFPQVYRPSWYQAGRCCLEVGSGPASAGRCAPCCEENRRARDRGID